MRGERREGARDRDRPTDKERETDAETTRETKRNDRFASRRMWVTVTVCHGSCHSCVRFPASGTTFCATEIENERRQVGQNFA